MRDKKELCELAVERGALPKLAALIKEITPTEKSPEWQEDELESVYCLREVRRPPMNRMSLHDVYVRQRSWALQPSRSSMTRFVAR